jgi:protein-disulfide isomerase
VVTIVEFVDFQCPHCRRLHDELSDVLSSHGDRVRVVRKHVPLPNHAMADGAVARTLGLDMDAYRSCVTSPAVAERIEWDLAAAKDAGVRGLPTFFIGNERFEGYRSADELSAAIERSLRTDA